MNNYFFGFTPSENLDNEINQVFDIVDNRPEDEFFPHQESLCNQIAHELINELFVKLVNALEDSKRKDKMNKLIDNINSAIDTMLKHVVTKQPNDKVIDSFNFLREECVFEDNDNNRRVGYALSDSDGKKLIQYFEQAKVDDQPNDILKDAMEIIIKNNIEHFVGKFGGKLHLGMIKRKALPVAETAISKACLMAVKKLLPELDKDACVRLTNHFEKLVIDKSA